VGDGISTSMFGGAKYMCSDIIQTMIPKNSCSKIRKVINMIIDQVKNTWA